jgi:pyridoxine kinase
MSKTRKPTSSATGNHVAYRRFQGRKSTPSEVASLYAGLQNAHLDTFDMMLSGYCPSAGLVQEVGKIARSLRARSATKPGSFFWVLDPVMGDNGRIYVDEDELPVYKDLLKDADLILPNQFEAELLSGVKITDLKSMHTAIETLHAQYKLPHILITSIRLPASQSATPSTLEQDLSGAATLSVVGSSCTAGHKPRIFSITVPALPIFFSGTGDMFAALMVSRLQQEAAAAGLLGVESWQSPDGVVAEELPLAKAAEKVLASMHVVLKDTAERYERQVEMLKKEEESRREGGGEDERTEEERETARHLRLTKAAEVRVVRNAKALREPPVIEGFKARGVRVDEL